MKLKFKLENATQFIALVHALEEKYNFSDPGICIFANSPFLYLNTEVRDCMKLSYCNDPVHFANASNDYKESAVCDFVPLYLHPHAHLMRKYAENRALNFEIETNGVWTLETPPVFSTNRCYREFVPKTSPHPYRDALLALANDVRTEVTIHTRRAGSLPFKLDSHDFGVEDGVVLEVGIPRSVEAQQVMDNPVLLAEIKRLLGVEE